MASFTDYLGARGVAPQAGPPAAAAPGAGGFGALMAQLAAVLATGLSIS